MRTLKLIFAILGSVLCLSAFAQYGSSKVSLYAQLNLATLGASNGNDCWGYVSPSGREYALMGCNNKVAFVEITNPSQPVYFASIPHSSSLWGDIKVYRDHAYIVSEASGVGIQVVDMSRIDEHIVTLVRTITNPGRSHNVAIDTRSGFLYTTGSNEGSGTTVCYDLSNPANPVKVGPSSMTNTYQHDIMAYTYVSGPYAGRQVLFGSSESRGVEIWDVTNKNSPYRIKRVSYPFVGYCHQAWLSRDEKYLYVDDEFDESNSGMTTRTIVIDVSSLENAAYVTSFTNNVNSIDHNQFWRDGFLFQANYRSGLRIWDTNDNPTSPTEVGFFDTYPSGDGLSYDGAWSTFPFFPSGTVIVSDINRGLFILNADEATTRKNSPFQFNLIKGNLSSGGIEELKSSDDNRMVILASASPFAIEPPVQLELSTKSMTPKPRMLRLGVESYIDASNGTMTVRVLNNDTGQWDEVANVPASTTEQLFELELSEAQWADYVNPSTLEMKMRLIWKAPAPPTGWPFTVRIDHVYWTIRS